MATDYQRNLVTVKLGVSLIAILFAPPKEVWVGGTNRKCKNLFLKYGHLGYNSETTGQIPFVFGAQVA